MAKFASVKHRKRSETKPPGEFNLVHNSRLHEPSYLLPEKHRKPNFHLTKISNAKKTIETWKNEAKNLYNKFHKRKMRSDAMPLEESILILSEEQVNQCDPDAIFAAAQKFIAWFESEYKTKVYSLDWHRDEGHITAGGVVSRNEHMHMVWRNVSDDGQMIRRQWKDRTLSMHQTKFAEIMSELGFKRGTKNERGKAPKSKHHRVFRREKQKEELATLNELKEQYKKERDALKVSGIALQSDYQNLKKRYNALKVAVKDKSLTISELQAAATKKDKEIEELQSAAAAAPSPFDLEAALSAAAAEKQKREKAEAQVEEEKKKRIEAEARAEKAKAKAEAAQQREKDVRARYDVILQEKNDEIETLKVKIAQLESDLTRAQKQLENARTTMQQRQAERKLEQTSSIAAKFKKRLEEKKRLEKKGAEEIVTNEKTFEVEETPVDQDKLQEILDETKKRADELKSRLQFKPSPLSQNQNDDDDDDIKEEPERHHRMRR